VNDVTQLRPRSIPGAYADARMDCECSHCGAAPGDWCTRPDGHYRRTPCIKRMYSPSPPQKKEHTK
jgi:hypothetical protein